MSNPTTNYLTWNPNTNSYQDLSGIFQPYTSGTKASNTGFTVAGYGDLSNIFAPIQSPPLYQISTNYKTSNGTDLSSIFNQPTLFTYTGSYTTTSNSTYKLIIICTGSGTFTNNYFNFPAFVNMVGGGGGGGSGTQFINFGRLAYNGGGGGGGGAFYSGNITFTKSNSYNFTVGQGGNGGSSGGNSSIGSIASANGGNGGNASTTSIGGSGGNSGNGNSGGGAGGVYGGGGGGGNTGSGNNGSINSGGNGGAGTTYSSLIQIPLTLNGLGGGGGGGNALTPFNSPTSGNPGLGTNGGGNGGGGSPNPQAGVENTGGGGGAGGYNNLTGASGGSGVIIIAYV